MVVLVGIGGSGKTILASQYLHTQKFPLVWEFKAKTEKSLMRSFEHLAYALSKTSEDKTELDSIKKLEDSRERTKRVLLFVKKRVKAQQGWCLLFDNVEDFTEIKKFYPLDPETWGIGKVIITTRDNTIKSNPYINPHAIIDVKELSEDEKLTLLTKIIDKPDPNLNSHTKDQLKDFLKAIPSFPLDVSTAGYFIKDTGISFEDYLERLKASSLTFENAQGTLLKETNHYKKTRYGIIALTLKNIIEKNANFRDLLLFI